jgi:proteic killer suppression protein
MIRTLKCKSTAQLFNDKYVAKFHDVLQVARRKMEVLNAAPSLESLKIPPGNNLEKLVGDRNEEYSIIINRKWRLCFEWCNGDAFNVEIVDYH